MTGNPIDYYEVHISQFTQSIYPNKGDTVLVGYDGMSPGPTFIVEKGRETVVRFVNNATMDSAVHLHGSYSVGFLAAARDSAFGCEAPGADSR